MLSGHLCQALGVALKVATCLSGVTAALVAWRAAILWLAASKVQIEDTTPRTIVSYDDNPALGILQTEVSGYATQSAYNASSALNARAARWTAWAAILSGVAAFLGVL